MSSLRTAASCRGSCQVVLIAFWAGLLTACAEDRVSVGVLDIPDADARRPSAHWLCVKDSVDSAEPCVDALALRTQLCSEGRVAPEVDACQVVAGRACWRAEACAASELTIELIEVDPDNLACAAQDCGEQPPGPVMSALACGSGRANGYTGRCVRSSDASSARSPACAWEVEFCNTELAP